MTKYTLRYIISILIMLLGLSWVLDDSDPEDIQSGRHNGTCIKECFTTKYK